MQELLISVVVTVYNKEKYFEECILSIINQSYQNLEILVINDGSTDKSLELMEIYEKIDNRIKIICTSNQGCSNARNIGINNFTGEYLVFIDGDDICMPDMIKSLYSSLIKYNADICVCNVLRINGDEVTTQTHDDDYYICLDEYGKNDYIRNFLFNKKHAYSIWNRMFSRKVITESKIYFRDFETIYPEDLLFNLEMVLFSKSVTWINEPLYMHFIRETGLTKGYRKNIVYRYLNCCETFRSVLLRNSSYEEMKSSFFYIVRHLTLCSFISLLRNNNANLIQFAKEIKKIYKWEFLKEAFTTDESDNNWRKLIVRLIQKDRIFVVSVLMYILFNLGIDFVKLK